MQGESKRPTSVTQQVDGNNILYHFLQKELFESDIWLFQMLSAKLVASLGIWFSPEVYQKLPILLPYAVRDPTCRKRKHGHVEEWGAPDSNGYLRDDNSLVKGLPKSLRINSTHQPLYSGKRLGNGYVASHVWRQIKNSSVNANLASRDPLLNTFVPNLVWLPAQVSKLTDREGTFTQLYLQALSAKIYRHLPVQSELIPFVERAWAMLEIPKGIPEQGLPNIDELSFFENSDRFLAERRRKIASVVNALTNIISGEDIPEKIITSRFGPGLKLLPHSTLQRQLDELGNYLSASLSTANIDTTQ